MVRAKVVCAVSLGAALTLSAGADADVTIGVSVATPAPPPVVAVAPPPLVIVPGTSVHYAPSVGFNLFVFGGHHYSFHEGAWFVAATSRGPWAVIATERVPRAVLAVPVAYYKIPPGHAKKMRSDVVEEHPGKGHGKKAKKGHDR
jgi:hypothetical protein